MTRFLLIHGSTQDSTGWQRLAADLRERGHECVALDLPIHEHSWTLADYAADIARHVSGDGTDTVVVAHSFSGVFLPLAAARAPRMLSVFLCAVVPEPRKSVRDQVLEDPTMFAAAWLAAGPRWADPAQHAELAREFLFHDCDDTTIRWAMTTLRMWDTAHLVREPSPLTEWPSGRAAAIVSAGDRTLSPDWCARRARLVLGVEPLEVAAGHCPHVSHPEVIGELLHGLVTDGGDA